MVLFFSWLGLALAARCIGLQDPGFSFSSAASPNATEPRTFGSIPRVFWTLAIPVIQSLKSSPPCISRC